VPGLKEVIKTNMNTIKHQHRARASRPMGAGNRQHKDTENSLANGIGRPLLTFQPDGAFLK
jgi:hypothetical protein